MGKSTWWWGGGATLASTFVPPLGLFWCFSIRLVISGRGEPRLEPGSANFLGLHLASELKKQPCQ